MEINLPVPAIFPKVALKPLLYVALSLIIVLISSGSFSRLEPLKFAPQPPESLDHLPLTFVANEGQAEPQVKFIVQSLGGTLLFTPVGLTLTLPSPDPAGASGRPTLVQVQFEGANPQVQISGAKKLPGRVNYFIGNDPDRWQTNLSTWAGLTYRALYPGINLDYTGQSGHLKSTYTVAPGVDPGQIRWRYHGVERVEIEPESGDLLIAVPLDGTEERYLLREQAPIAWQDIDGRRVMVEVSYTLTAHHQVGFAAGAYHPAYPLMIDPITLAYSTYLGGDDFDWGWAVTTDDDGYLYVTGMAFSTNFPTKNGYSDSYNGGRSDIFIAKLDPNQSGDSSLIYSTYLGGGGTTSMNEIGQDIAVDHHGNVYVTGITQAYDFPIQNGYDSTKGDGLVDDNTSNDAFVAKLDATGSVLLYSTYLGGAEQVDDVATSIAVDDLENAYVTGLTASADFPTQNAYQSSKPGNGLNLDAFLVKLDTTQAGAASLIYGTYLGGDGPDYGIGVAVDDAGYAYVSGFTKSANFPTKNGYQSEYAGGSDEAYILGGGDAFVVKLDTTQSGAAGLIYGTYLGGSGNEGDTNHEAGDIAIDPAGYIYVIGNTNSTDFPIKNAYQNSNKGGDDVFIAKLDATQTGHASLIYSTYFGGTSKDLGYDIAVDSAGNTYITGSTLSTNFPVQGAYQEACGGDDNCLHGDAFIVKLSAAGNSLLYGSYLGGANEEVGYGITLDYLDNIYITGRTASDDFPTKNAYQDDYANTYDGFVTQLKIIGEGQPALHLSAPELNLDQLNFGHQPVGQTGPAKMITLQSVGDLPVAINSITASDSYTQTHTCPLNPNTLAVNASCTISITFSPLGPGIISGTLMISSDAANSPHIIYLNGTGQPVPKLYLPVILAH